MHRLVFRINRISKKKFRRLRRLSHPPNTALKAAQDVGWLAVGGIGVYVLGLLVPNMVAILAGTPSAVIKGHVFIGSHVTVIRDISGSMSGTEADLNAQMDRLTASGMTTQVRDAQGFGVSPTGGRSNLLHQIEEALNSTPELDTIYAFSDFEVANMSAWKSDQEGYERLKELLTTNRARLYLGTVRHPPPSQLVLIARESGGGLITN